MEDARQKLKKVRERLGLKFRDVEEASLAIAARRNNDEFVINLSRLSDIENKGTVPSIYRLYTLCVIYRLELTEVLGWYGINLSALPADAASVELERTHLLGFHPEEGDIQVPLSLDPGFDPRRTSYLSRVIQRWGTVPLLLLGNFDLKNHRYGLIGTEDWSMYPMLQPGSLVLIDETRRKVANSGWSNEFQRPIYFLEHRKGYSCCWCTLNESSIMLQPHPASMCSPEIFLYPDEIDVLGQVTGVAMLLNPGRRRRIRS